VADFVVDGRIAGEEAGEGTPVVLLHGLTATRRYVVMGSRSLERSGHRVVMYDARGHGASAPAEGYDYTALAADLGAVMDDRGIGHAVLAGASMGAHTIVRFALDQPERVRAVCLITPAHEPGEEHDAERLARWDKLAAGLREGGVEGFVEAYGEPSAGPEFRETIFKVLRQRLGAHEHPEAVADALQQVPRSAPFDSWADLGEIQAPAVVVASRDEADPGHPLATGQRWAELIPGADIRTEAQGKSPLAWQGGQLSKVIEELAARA
jgi:pimeloyl-ACP methyl ester carboxylesterase